ncbi:hypothetical protein ABBQ32_005162 [Trebouxia sp. C0010 RCD-2024]
MDDTPLRRLHVDVKRSTEISEHHQRVNSASTASTTGSPRTDGSQARFPISKLKLDNLFLQWLSMAESQSLVLSLLEDAKAGRQLARPAESASPLSPSAAQNLFAATTPPLSPQKARSPESPQSPSRRQGSTQIFTEVKADSVPQFYFPGGKPVPSEVREQALAKIDDLFRSSPDGLAVPAVRELVKEVFQLPKALAYPLFYKLVAPNSSSVTRDSILSWFDEKNVVQVDPVRRMFDILRKENCFYVAPDDLKSMMAGILLSHPGLEFLQETPEFQDRYAETVIHRIFYRQDKGGSGRLSFRDLKRGDLLHALTLLDEEEDINKVLKYFSYEHFYVIYCKFWELDNDHDFLISKEDLIRYGNHSLTYRIVERVFQQAGRPFRSKESNKMGYEDFVWFIMSEEDKSSDMALDYWFKCCDLDGDGCLRANEMLFFYSEQLHRMECLSQEPVLFEDVLCQMHDMIQPAKEGCFSLADLKRHKQLAGTLFNMLFNLHKFIAFETRDPFLARQEREDANLSDWDRFARTEYIRLAMEEEGEEAEPESSTDLWESSVTESAF